MVVTFNGPVQQSQVVESGAIGIQHQNNNAAPANLDELIGTLRANGVPGEDIVGLRSAIAADDADDPTRRKGMGSRVGGWLRSTTGKIGTGATAGVIAVAVEGYLKLR